MCDDDFEADEDWDRVMSMTDAELDAELAAANREMEEAERAWEARTPRPQQYARHRRDWLELCHKGRHSLFTRTFPDLGRENLKRYQMGLWKVRWWYRTGQWPTSDA